MSHTPGPWSQGALLLTTRTKSWSEEERQRAHAHEQCMVFSNGTPVAQCVTPEDAKLIASAPDLLERNQKLATYLEAALNIIKEQRVCPNFQAEARRFLEAGL